MKRMMIASDWTHGLLRGDVGAGHYNLDDPENISLLNRLVARYDTFMFGWFSVPVRDRLRKIASEQGREIEIYKYVDPTGWRPSETTGSMSLAPTSSMVISRDGRRCLRPEWCLRKSDNMPIRAASVEESGFLVDPTGRGLLEVAKAHLLTLAEGFDGIFLDLLSPTYFNEVGNQTDSGDYRWPLRGWSSVPGYAEAKLELHSTLADHLAKYDKKCMHNTTNYWHNGAFWPRFCAESSKKNITFIENFASTWQSHSVTEATPGYGQWLKPTLEYMDWCNRQARPAAFQFLSNDADRIRYGYTLFLQGAGEQSIFSGCALNSAQLYSLEPTEIKDYEINLGAPVAPRIFGSALTRSFEKGLVATNTSNQQVNVALEGCYRTRDESSDTTHRLLSPASGVMMLGQPFGVASVSPRTPGALTLGANGWNSYA